MLSTTGAAQSTSITFQLNGRPSNENIEKGGVKSKNPFVKFIGEWTLKDDRWTQNWGGGKEEIRIANHHTVSREINTDLSMLSIIDGPQPNGHIFWSYDPATKVFHHLSSFGSSRSGTGTGTINENGDLAIRISFSDEAKGTYRRYTYKWLNEDEYELMSVQYNEHDQPTGLFYGGIFVRMKK